MSKKDMMDDLKRSGLTPNQITKLKFKHLTSTQTKKILNTECEAYQIPYFNLDNKPSGYTRYRMLPNVEIDKKVLGKKRKVKPSKAIPKYLQVKGTKAEVYFAPVLPWKKIAKNTKIPLIITEGEKKAAIACLHKHPTIGLGGVYSFGSRARNLKLLPALEAFEWEDREVVIMYDSDLVTNDNVKGAMFRLARVLNDKGAFIQFAYVPEGEKGEKQGIDDYLLNKNHTMKTLLEEAIDEDFEFMRGEMMHKLSSEVALIEEMGDFMMMHKGIIMSRDKFVNTYYADHTFTEEDSKGNTKKISASAEYIKWPKRTVLNKIVYSPQPIIDTEANEPLPVQHITEDNNYNAWQGWGAVPAKGNIKPWHDLLNYIFKGEPEKRNHFEQWLAYPLQNITYKQNTSYVIWSTQQGTGKSLIGEIIGKIYGKNYGKINEAQLTKDFTEWAVNKHFIMGEETTEQGSLDKKSLAEKLKLLISGLTIPINRKYQSEYSIENWISYLFTSNRGDAYYLEDSDRRYNIHEIKYGKQDIAFYKRIDNWYKKQESINALLYYLFNEVSLEGYNPDVAIDSEDKERMKDENLTPIQEWVKYDLLSGQYIMVGQDAMARDVYSIDEIITAYDPSMEPNKVRTQMRKALSNAGCRCITGSNQAYTNHGRKRLWAVRNVDKWLKTDMVKIVNYYNANYKDETIKPFITKEKNVAKFKQQKPKKEK